MGDEADADWQAGLVEWGYEDAERAMQEERRAAREARRLKQKSRSKDETLLDVWRSRR